MKEEMYIPGQDDFPGWDEFYAPRGSVRSRMRYSFKTLLLLPPLAGFLCFMYLTGYKNGNRDEVELKASLATEGQLRKSAEALAETRAATGISARREIERTNRQALVTMKALNSLLTRIKTDWGTARDDDARRHLIDSTADELQAITVELDHGASGDQGLFERHLVLGKIFLLLPGSEKGGSDDAHRQFRLAYEVAKSQVDSHPTDIQAQRDLFTSAALLGELDFRLGRLETARTFCEEALEMAQRLAQADPKNIDLKHDLGVALGNLGDVQLELGDAAAARDNYDAALNVSEALAAVDPQSDELQRDLLVSLAKVGDAHLELTGAVALNHGAPAELERLQEQSLSDPRTARNWRDIYRFYSRIDDGNRQAAELKAARNAYQRSLEIARRLAGKPEPAFVSSDHKVGQLPDPTPTSQASQVALENLEQTERDKPQGPVSHSDLAHTLARIAAVEMAAEDFSTAARDLDRAIAELTALDNSEKGAGSLPYKSWLDDLRAKSQACKLATRGIEDLDFALRQSKAVVPRLLGIRSRALARKGERTTASATAEKLVALETKRGDLLFSAAEAYALCATSAAGSKPADNAECDRYGARAVDLLRQSERLKGFDIRNFTSSVLADQNLASLFDRDDFQKLIADEAEAAEQTTKDR
jgi:tetratricopeptide (TPR) repeat protein